MEIRSLGYRTDLMVLRAGGSLVTDRGDHLVVRTPDNPTYFWGNFVLFERPGVLGEMLEVFGQEFPEAEHVALGIDSVDGEVADEAGLTAAGFIVGRDTVMTATDVVAPRLPTATATLRALSTDDDWAQQVELRLSRTSSTTTRSFARSWPRRWAVSAG